MNRLQIIVTAFLDFLDQRMVVRRFAFFWVLWITERCITWTLAFAGSSPRGGMEVAAIIGAIWIPITALQGAVFHLYNNGRRDQDNGSMLGTKT
jgi:hypothetical protein